MSPSHPPVGTSPTSPCSAHTEPPGLLNALISFPYSQSPSCTQRKASRRREAGPSTGVEGPILFSRHPLLPLLVFWGCRNRVPHTRVV